LQDRLRIRNRLSHQETTIMAWTRPVLREICIGMEINGYLAGKL
jgi:coenzyme PQQ precursor peptide PqqA